MTTSNVSTLNPVNAGLAQEIAREYMMDKDWLGAASSLLLANLPVPVGIWNAVRAFIEEPVRVAEMNKAQVKAFNAKCNIVLRALATKDKHVTIDEVVTVVTAILSARQERAKLVTINHDGSWLLSQQVDRVKASHYNGFELDEEEDAGSPLRSWNFSYRINKAVAEVVKLGGLRQIDDFLTEVLTKIYDKRFDVEATEDHNLEIDIADSEVDKAQLAESFCIAGVSDYTRHISRDPYDLI